MTDQDIEEWREWLLSDVLPENRNGASELCDLALAGNKYQDLRAAVEELLEVAFFDDDMIGEDTQAALTVLGRLLHGQTEQVDDPS